MNTITQLSDRELVRETESLRAKEKRLLHKLLGHFGEVDSRKLYRDEGYSSMYAYLRDALGYSEGGAYRRIAVARLVKRYPEVYSALEAGELTLSTASGLAKCSEDESFLSLLERAKGMTSEEVSQLVAKPKVVKRKETVRVVRAVPPKRAVEPSAESSLLIEGELEESTSKMEVMEELGYSVNIHVDGEFMRLYREVKALAGGRSMKDVFGKVLKDYVKRNSPKEKQKRRSASAKATANTESRKVRMIKASSSKQTRHIPAPVKDEVFLRDNHQCTFKSDTGNRCCATEHLEVDHIVPFARGGSHDPENLRLLCRAHNQLEAERVFGREAIEACRQ